jgi:uncharacterized protein YndB with AHSA1/START domain
MLARSPEIQEMTTRSHTHHIEVPEPPEVVFALLHTPSAIRHWWSATHAIVLPQTDGIWVGVWGADEDRPDYISAFRIRTFDPPRRMVLTDSRYFSKDGRLPFQADFLVEFTIEARPGGGSRLRVVHDGFPAEPIADSFFADCETGWRNTFAGIERYLAERRSGTATQLRMQS